MAKKKGKKMSATPIPPPKGARKQGAGTGENPLGYRTNSQKGKK